MQQLANALVLSQSATPRLEKRGLLTRYLCEDDRRGIYTEVTQAGVELLNKASPTHDKALTEATDLPELAPWSAP